MTKETRLALIAELNILQSMLSEIRQERILYTGPFYARYFPEVEKNYKVRIEEIIGRLA